MDLDITCLLLDLFLEASHRVSSHPRLRVCLLKPVHTPCFSKPLAYVKKQRMVCVLSWTKLMIICAGPLLEYVRDFSLAPSKLYVDQFKSAAKFQYTFFDAFGQNNNIPEIPITPFPTLFTAPVYRPANNTVELTVSNFFYEDNKTRAQTPLDVYLGNIGPLRQRVYQASPPGPLTNISPFVQSLTGEPGPSGEHRNIPSPVAGPPQYMPSGPIHTIVVVEMPPLADVIKALEADALPVNGDGTGSGQHSPTEATVHQQSTNGAPPSIAGRSLPLLFIRASDGVGYHSGRTIACENVFQTMDLGSMGNPPNPQAASIDTGWLAAAQAA